MSKSFRFNPRTGEQEREQYKRSERVASKNKKTVRRREQVEEDYREAVQENESPVYRATLY